MSDDGPVEGWDWKVPTDPLVEFLFADEAYLDRIESEALVILAQWADRDADRLRLVIAERYVQAFTAAGMDPYDPTTARVVALTADFIVMLATIITDSARVEDQAVVLAAQALRVAGR